MLNSIKMFIPKRRIINTIGVKYVQGNIKDKHYEQIIEDTLKLGDEDILKIEEINTTYFAFKVQRQVYERICNEEAYKFIRLDADSNVIIEDISSYETEVKIQYFGLEIEEADIIQIFSAFGDIKHHYHRARPNVKYFLGRQTGRMVLKMELNKPIPSALYIKDTNTYIHVGHENQPTTCHNCGDTRHKKIACTKKEGTGTNAIELAPGTDEDLGSNAGEPDNVWSEALENIDNDVVDSDEEPVNDVEEETPAPDTPRESNLQENASATTEVTTEDAKTPAMPPPQVSPVNDSSLVKSVSEPISSQDEVLESHMRTHTGENLNSTPKLEPVSETSSLDEAQDTHMLNHTGEKPYSIPQLQNELDSDAASNLMPPHTGDKTTSAPKGDNAILDVNPAPTMYTCNSCKIAYTAEKDLTEHTQAHQGQGIFKCLDCNFKSTYHKSFTHHIVDKAHMKDEINGGKTRKSYSNAVKKTIKRQSNK